MSLVLNVIGNVIISKFVISKVIIAIVAVS